MKPKRIAETTITLEREAFNDQVRQKLTAETSKGKIVKIDLPKNLNAITQFTYRELDGTIINLVCED